jgi:tetratricopeptide (TPR) repeat protein
MVLETLNRLLASGEYLNVLNLADEGFANAQTDSEAARIAATAAKAARLLTQYDRTARWARRGLERHTAPDDVKCLLHVLAGTALLWVQKDLKQAERHLKTAMHLAGKEPALQPLRVICRFNLAYLHRAEGKLDSSLREFKQAQAQAERSGQAEIANSCFFERAWTALQLGRPDLAPEWLNQGQRRADPESELATDLKTAWALYWLQMQHFDEARALCYELQAEPALPRQVAEAHWILGWIALFEGDLSTAQSYSEEALTLALQDPYPAHLERIGQLSRAILEAGQG